MNITKDKVEAYGMIVLAVFGVYAVYKAYSLGKSIADTIAADLNKVKNIGSAIIAPVTNVIEGVKNPSPVMTPTIVGPYHDPIYDPVPGDSVYDPVTGVIIGMDTSNGGRQTFPSQFPSPNAFMAMSGNSENVAGSA